MTKIHLQTKLAHGDSPVDFKSGVTIAKLTNKLFELESTYPGILQEEFVDWLEIIEMGAKKYAPNNWLLPNGKKSSEQDMHNSMMNHWRQSVQEGADAKDHESGKDPLLHLACRAMMVYIRRKRGIVHDEDK